MWPFIAVLVGAAGLAAGWVACRCWHVSRWDETARWSDSDRNDWLGWLRKTTRDPSKPTLFDGSAYSDWEADA